MAYLSHENVVVPNAGAIRLNTRYFRCVVCGSYHSRPGDVIRHWHAAHADKITRADPTMILGQIGKEIKFVRTRETTYLDNKETRRFVRKLMRQSRRIVKWSKDFKVHPRNYPDLA